MRRREFITLISATVAWPLAARTQQPTMPVIGYLGSASPDLYAKRLRAFHQGLKEAGFVEGQNVAIEYRWAEDQNERLPALAAELVHRQVAVIVAGGGTTSAVAAKAATATIPIVFAIGGDPIKIGLVASLNRPGGNMTGITALNIEVVPKRLELLRELLPRAAVIALLINPTNPSLAEPYTAAMKAAASTLELQLYILQASTAPEFNRVLAVVNQFRADALVIMPDNFFNASREQLAALTLRHAIPAISEYREFVAAGGLISYGSDEAEYYRLLGTYTGKILKGEKPADMPVVQSTKVELIVNLKTAKALGINVPNTLIGRADEVIE